MNEILLPVQKTARIITIGELSKKTQFIWIALHGYGQLSTYMAGKLEFLDTQDHFIICPEGLNKFYWHKNNEPVACWMTKDNRYAEISNFVNYLDEIYHTYCTHVSRNVKIVLLGFSQGCASLWRWIHASSPKFDYLINWAGWIPEDISYLHLKPYFLNKQILYVYGEHDEFINEESVISLQNLIHENDLKIQFRKYEGKHSLSTTFLQTIIKESIH